jgi:hypothetical protein
MYSDLIYHQPCYRASLLQCCKNTKMVTSWFRLVRLGVHKIQGELHASFTHTLQNIFKKQIKYKKVKTNCEMNWQFSYKVNGPSMVTI